MHRLNATWAVWNSAAFEAWWETSGRWAVHLNLHKTCESGHNPVVFRASLLLSRGATIISEHAHAKDEAEYAAMCQERAANGYNSGMGEIFRRVAAVSPVPLARPSASRQLEQAAIAGSSSSTATTSGGGGNSSGDEETPISEPEVEWSATPRPPPPTPAEEACTVE